MKHTILLAMTAMMAVTASAGQIDTLVVNNPHRVTVISGDSLQRISIEGREGDADYRYQNTIRLVDSNYVSTTRIGREHWGLFSGIPISKKKEGGKRYSTSYHMHFGVGFTAPVSVADGISFPVGASWEFYWNIVELRHSWGKKHHNYTSIGFALDWRNYRMTGTKRFMKDADDNLVVADYPEGAKQDFSRIKVLSLSVPILYGHKFRHGGFALGPVICFNTRANVKTRYTLDGGKHKDMTRNIHQQPVTVDMMLMVGLPALPNFYLKYSPFNVLDTSVAPRFRSLSFGIYL